MTWFETLTGFREESPERIRENMTVEGSQMKSKVNGRSWKSGHLETPSLAELRQRAKSTSSTHKRTSIREVVADVQTLHCDDVNAGAMFQVASQFNLLEMTSPNIEPEAGIGIYENDFTQGPACAIAAGAGTIYRNYFVEVNRKIGQTYDNQINCLAEIGELLGNKEECYWRMVNGYMLPEPGGLEAIHRQLSELDETEKDQLRAALLVGLHRDTQVTLHGSTHLVSQIYCSALPVRYTRYSPDLWAPIARLILEAAYEATLCAAIENAVRTQNNRLYLTLLGGGAFGNQQSWIFDAIQRAVCIYPNSGLDLSVVSYGDSKPEVKELADNLTTIVSNSRN